MIEPLTCSMTSFSMRFRSVIFFHARKFEAPTNLFLSLQKDILTDSDEVINILTCVDASFSTCFLLEFDDDIDSRKLFLDEDSFLQELLLTPQGDRLPLMMNVLDDDDQ